MDTKELHTCNEKVIGPKDLLLQFVPDNETAHAMQKVRKGTKELLKIFDSKWPAISNREHSNRLQWPKKLCDRNFPDFSLFRTQRSFK